MKLRRSLAGFAVGLAVFGQARAMTITGYSSAANDRFSSGYPTSPVDNTNEAFVGLGYDWSGVGWASSDATKSFGFLTPQHYLVARHYGGAATVDLLGGDGAVTGFAQASVQQTGYGLFVNSNYDLSLGTLSSPIPTSLQIARYAVLDLNNSSTSNTPSNYNGLSILAYGRGPNASSSTRVGEATIQATQVDIGGNGTWFRTTRDDVQLQSGDSGSPAFAAWTNPNGSQELALLGNNAAIDTTNGFNYMNFVGTHEVMAQLNTMINDDGWALRVVGNPSATWQGQSSTNINNRGSWGLSAPASAPSDLFVLFDAGAATSRTVNVNAAWNLRGLYFKSSAASGDGFAFSGSNTLTIGRGGVTNYDADVQTFSAPLRLGDSQVWDGGTGGMTAGAIDTNGKLLEIGGAGTNRINGDISGSGSLAISDGHLILSGDSTYTGPTWIHSGMLDVNGSIASSSEIRLGTTGSLRGSGIVSGITGSGSVDPGSSPGILAATSVDPSEGMSFNFEFTQTGSPDYADAFASGNDVLRLTGAVPFSQALSASNAVNIYLNVTTLSLNDVFLGGFFTDWNESFFGSIQSATFAFYQATVGGTTVYNDLFYSLYEGPFSFQVGTVSEMANFASGSVNGWVMEFTVVPEPSAYALLGVLVALIAVLSRRRIVLQVQAQARDRDR